MSKQSKKKKKKVPVGPSTPVQPVQKNIMVDGYVKKVQPPKKSVTKQEISTKSKRNIKRVLFVSLTVFVLWGLFYWGAGFFNKNLFNHHKTDSTTTTSVQPKKDSVISVSKPVDTLKVVPKKPPPKAIPKEEPKVEAPQPSCNRVGACHC